MHHPAYLYSFIIYFLAVLTLCLMAWHYASNLSDYILGGRSLGPAIAALGVGASDMSSWLLMALPGAVYLHGITQIWIPIGLLLGAYLSWIFVAKPLRIYTEHANDALTIPSFFDARVCDPKGIIRATTALVILFFFTVYAAAGFKGGGLLFASVFHLNLHIALLSSALFIVLYTTIGGFLAISWVDFFQGCLLFAAIIAVPVIAYHSLQPIQHEHLIASLHHSLLPQSHRTIGILSAISLMAWGLGYFGQPHILVRFMAVKDPQHMPISRRIHILWMLAAIAGAFAIGLLGPHAIPHPLSNPESVFLILAKECLPPWLAGLLFAIMLSAIMSAISAQLLAAASALTADLYRRFRSRELSDRHLLYGSRLMVLFLGLVALFIANTPSTNIFKLASYAWAGLGASFGPCVLLSLYWRKLSASGAISGIIAAAITVVTWKALGSVFGGIFHIYEILPAFIMNLLVATTVSLIWPDDNPEKLHLFDKAKRHVAS